jgi:hypothetical protein
VYAAFSSEETLARAISHTDTEAALQEAELQQAEARAEATRLAGEAERFSIYLLCCTKVQILTLTLRAKSWLKNGDLDMALIMADRAQVYLCLFKGVGVRAALRDTRNTCA